MKEKVEKTDATGAHGGYTGAGTFILQYGERIPVDPVTLQPLSEPEPEPEPLSAPVQVPEKTKSASEPAKKVVSDTNKTE